MLRAQEEQVPDAGLTAVRPVLDVMTLEETMVVAAIDALAGKNGPTRRDDSKAAD
jgi:hypothetical protein